ncbi:hypothetical protein A1D22_04020 [Pasteurellaceae bacterium LFhippo2]|nr:hypothetical protein [Pasteurellaceae bacterium LFhippo2]
MSKLPSGWKREYLGKVAELQRGFDLPSSKRIEGTIPIISSSGISGYHNEAKVLAPGVVTGRYGTIGNVFYVEQNFWPLNTSLWVKNFYNNHPKFIYYLLSNFDFAKFSDKTGVPGVNRNDLHAVKVLVPPLPEQIKIAETLSTWDNAIQATESLIANSQQQKKALMQMLLSGEKRVGGFSGEWKKIKLGKIADMSSGGTPKSTVEEYYNGGILWVSIADMTAQGKYITRSEKTISELGVENSSAKLYPKNTILYAMYASIGECSIATVPVTSSQAILGIRPKDELYFEYLYFYLSSLKDKIKLQGQQGTQSNLNAGMVKDFDILLPSVEEQQKIAKILTAADQEIETLQQKLECLKLEKQALMQILLG